MSGFKGTPGPWVYSEMDGALWVYQSAYAAPTKNASDVGVIRLHGVDPGPVQQANACLIAAAPTMHASLQEIQEFTRDAPDDHPLSYVYALACAGLAKSRVGIAQASAGADS